MLHFKLKGITKCSIMTINILQADTPTSLYDPIGEGVESSKFNFFRTWLRCISNKRLSRMQKHGCKYFACRPPPPPPNPADGVNRSKVNFSEHGQVIYQIKGTHERSNMLQIFCLQTPPIPHPHPPPHTHIGDRVNRSKFNFYQNMVKLHIKLEGISNMVANILPADPPPPTLGLGSIGQKSTFSEQGSYCISN